MRPQAVSVLGSTGSIGASALQVMAAHPDRFQVFALAANKDVDRIYQQCQQFQPRFAVMTDPEAARRLRRLTRENALGVEVASGAAGLELVASHEEADCVIAAIVGGAGLLPSMAAARAGKKILLANKEALVMAGPLFMAAVRQSGAALLPIDSEHNAMFQCLPVNEAAMFDNSPAAGFEKIVLTASGGPFLNLPVERFAQVSPAQACAHPNWKMGRKISVDSATMANKALELIEACYLFELAEDRIQVMMHPQSIIHSLVHYCDGSALAQLGNPDMRTPIAYGLAWPERVKAGVKPLDLAEIGRLEFFQPDLEKFPALGLGREAAKAGGTAPVLLNAANEVAVAAFLQGALSFDQIPVIIDAALQERAAGPIDSMETVLAEDQEARRLAGRLINQLADQAPMAGRITA